MCGQLRLASLGLINFAVWSLDAVMLCPAKVARKKAQPVLMMLGEGVNPNDVKKANIASQIDAENNRKARSLTLQDATEQYSQLKYFQE